MVDELRTCTRTGCRWPAAASLSFAYATRQVWLLDLPDAHDPTCYDLCPHHAEDLTVPRGWMLVDERSRRPAPREPAGAELVRRAEGRLPPPANVAATARRREPRPGGRRNRYGQLTKELPRLAARYGEGAAGDDELQGRPAVAQAPTAADPAPTAPPAAAIPPELPGQLVLPLWDTRPTPPTPPAPPAARGGVVVSIAAAGMRRRPLARPGPAQD